MRKKAEEEVKVLQAEKKKLQLALLESAAGKTASAQTGKLMQRFSWQCLYCQNWNGTAEKRCLGCNFTEQQTKKMKLSSSSNSKGKQ